MGKKAKKSMLIAGQEPELRQEYIEKIERALNGKFIRVDDFAKRYGLK